MLSQETHLPKTGIAAKFIAGVLIPGSLKHVAINPVPPRNGRQRIILVELPVPMNPEPIELPGSRKKERCAFMNWAGEKRDCYFPAWPTVMPPAPLLTGGVRVLGPLLERTGIEVAGKSTKMPVLAAGPCTVGHYFHSKLKMVPSSGHPQ